MSLIKRLFWNILAGLALPIFLAAALLPSRRRTCLVWGSRALLSNKYWSAAMREAGHESLTIMEGWYAINSRDDFDRYFIDFAPAWLPRPLRVGVGACGALVFLLRRGRVLHTSFDGFALRGTIWWRFEHYFCRMARVKTVVMSYGADAYLYSQVLDTSLRTGLLASYPQFARVEDEVRRRVRFWNRHADIVLVGPMLDGLGRWDVTTNCIFTINTDDWTPKDSYSRHDGRSGPVRILHTPNHRGFKGSEFVVAAVDTLRAEGLQIDLVLLEGVPNKEVREIMRGTDILAEQFIAVGYALSGIEGLASGLPVLCNLENPVYTTIFRRYGFLDECPVVSSKPERLADDLRLLVTNPALREELGRASRAFAEKYHSNATARHMFGSIYDRILHGKDVDLIHLFHPLKSSYNRASPRIAHPLIENRLPSSAERSC
jgi:hypothetical protein